MNCVPGFFLLPTILQFLMALILGWFILLLGAPSRFFHVDTNQSGTEISTLAKVFDSIQAARFHLLLNQINGITHPPEDFVAVQHAKFVKSGHSLDNCKAMI